MSKQQIIYMKMPETQDILTGIYVAGEDVPNDPQNPAWQAYQTFLAEGGRPLEFDPTRIWDGSSWVIDSDKQALFETQQAAQTLATAEAELNQHRANADNTIAPLQDAADLGMGNAEETAQLKAWKRYRMLLNRVPQQENWPAAPDWPPLPSTETTAPTGLLQTVLSYFKPEAPAS